jgi:hypothetical protein
MRQAVFCAALQSAVTADFYERIALMAPLNQQSIHVCITLLAAR